MLFVLFLFFSFSFLNVQREMMLINTTTISEDCPSPSHDSLERVGAIPERNVF
jgi:hypothetical protein